MITDSPHMIPWTLTDLFSWIYWDRLFSRFPFISALTAVYSGLSSKHRQVPPLITDELSLLINYRVKLTGTPWEDCIGSTTPALKLGGSASSSGPFRLAACVLGTGQNSVSTHISGMPGGTPQSSWRLTTTTISLWYIMKIYPMEIKVSSAKLQKSFRTNVCCPTPKHVTTQLFRNFHYQEFYYMDRQIQSKLKKCVSSWKP